MIRVDNKNATLLLNRENGTAWVLRRLGDPSIDGDGTATGVIKVAFDAPFKTAYVTEVKGSKLGLGTLERYKHSDVVSITLEG